MFSHKEGQYLHIEGADIYYEVQGNLNEPAIVFLHGGFEDIEIFNSIVPFFEKDYCLIGIDSRGQGRSTLGTVLLTYEQIQQDVTAVLSHLQLNRFSMIGHSDGGIVALRLAAENKFEFEKLITIGARWALKANDPARNICAEVTPEMWRNMFPDQYEKYQQLNPAPDFVKIINALVTMWLDTSIKGHPCETVGQIKAPLLVIRGDEDILVSRENAFELANRVDKAILYNVPFAGHVTHVDRPEWIASAIRVFLKRRDN